MHRIALPMLYHDIVLGVTTPNAKRLANFKGVNRGLEHLRTLTLTSDPDRRATTQAATTVNQIFKQIPPSAWDKMHWHADGALLAEVTARVEQRHAQISTTVVIAGEIPHYISSTSADAMVLLWEERGRLYELLRSFDSMGFVGVTLTTRDPSRYFETLVFLVRGGYVHFITSERSQTLCGATPQPPRSTLLLHRGCFAMFSGTGRGLSPCAKLRHLTSLILQDCSRPIDFLDWLLRMNFAGSLKVLVITESQDTKPRDVVRRPPARFHIETALETFLLGFQGLRTLIVSAPFLRLPSSKAVTNHAKTLRELYIAKSHGLIAYPKHWSRTEDWVAEVCRMCTQLEQIAVPLPKLVLVKMILANNPAPHSLFTYTGHIPSEEYSFCQEFKSCLVSLSKLPRLVTVRMLNVDWAARPAPAMACNAATLCGRTHNLAALVLRYFHEQQTELTVISFGVTGEFPGDKIEDGPLCFFIHGSRLADWEEKRASMVQMKAARVRLEEPRTEILDVHHEQQGYLRFPRLTK